MTPTLPPAPRRILVAVDGSEPSERAVRLAITLARLTGGELRLLTAIELKWIHSIGLGTAPTEALAVEVERAIRQDADAHLDRLAELCRSAGVPCTATVEHGAPHEVIRDAALTADLLVLGSRGRGALSGAILGSVSHRVVGAAVTPVLVVH